MKEFFQVLRRFVPPYKKYLVLTVIFNILSAILNIFSFLAIMPILKILFKIDTTDTHPVLLAIGSADIKEVLTNNMNYYVYLQYRKGKFEAKAKSVLSEAGEHMYLMGGYGVSYKGPDGHWEYEPLRTSSTWASVSYGTKWQVMLMGGYIKNLGTASPLVADVVYQGNAYTDSGNLYFNGNGFSNLNEMWRIIPTVVYNFGKLSLSLEWNITSARYGDYYDFDGKGGKYLDAETGLAAGNLHWVTNHRILMMVKYTF